MLNTSSSGSDITARCTELEIYLKCRASISHFGKILGRVTQFMEFWAKSKRWHQISTWSEYKVQNKIKYKMHL